MQLAKWGRLRQVEFDNAKRMRKGDKGVGPRDRVGRDGDGADDLHPLDKHGYVWTVR